MYCNNTTCKFNELGIHCSKSIVLRMSFYCPDMDKDFHKENKKEEEKKI